MPWLGDLQSTCTVTRSTQDIDLLLLPSPQNAEKVVAALEAFGFGKGGVDPSLFQSPGQVVHLGVEPNRIDLLTSLNGLDTETIFSHLNRIDLQGRICPIISLEDLLVIKKASPRLKDRADAEELEQINQALS